MLCCFSLVILFQLVASKGDSKHAGFVYGEMFAGMGVIVIRSICAATSIVAVFLGFFHELIT